jgi:hypothetical protein
MIFTSVAREKGWPGRAIDSIGDLDGLISASRNDEVAIRRPGQRVNFTISVPAVFEDLLSGVKMIAMLDRSPIAQGAIP